MPTVPIVLTALGAVSMGEPVFVEAALPDPSDDVTVYRGEQDG